MLKKKKEQFSTSTGISCSLPKLPSPYFKKEKLPSPERWNHHIPPHSLQLFART
jgi:hypothetical protein